MPLPSLSNILLGDQYIGVEHYTLDNEDKAAFLLIEKKKDSLEIAAKDDSTPVGNFPEKWNKKLPFYLVINTNQVIQKEIDGTDSNNEKLVHKAFPNLDLNDFYFEIWRLKSKSVIAIARKNYIDTILSSYEQEGVYVAGISLGINAVSGIKSYFEDTKLETITQSVCWDEVHPVVTNNNQNITAYNLNGLEIGNKWILSFAGILRLIVDNGSTSGNIIDYNSSLYSNYIQRSFFSRGIKLMVCSLLTILLINFFVFNHYYKKAQEADITLSSNQSLLEDTSTIKSRIQSKAEKVKNFTDLSSSKSSQIINDIASIIPSSILLTELAFHPLEKKIKVEEPIITQDKTIVVSGTTVNNLDFTQWIEKIESLKKVQNVTIVNFGKDEANTTVFTLTIALK